MTKKAIGATGLMFVFFVAAICFFLAVRQQPGVQSSSTNLSRAQDGPNPTNHAVVSSAGTSRADLKPGTEINETGEADGDLADVGYQKLYYNYRDLVVSAIKNNKEASLSTITDEYASKTGKKILLVSVSILGSPGKWRVLLHKTDPNTSVNLPKIHYIDSETVHIHKGKGFVLCESNKTRNGAYTDNIYIRMAIKK